MIVLGLDLSLTHTGWAILCPSLVGQGRATFIDGYVYNAPGRKDNESHAAWNMRRCYRFNQFLRETIASYSLGPNSLIAYEWSDRPRRAHWVGGSRAPATIGTEYQSAYGLGVSEGFLIAFMCALASEYKIDLLSVPVSVAKQMVTGAPDAPKGRVVQSLLRLVDNMPGTLQEWRDKGVVPDDLTDAISIAYVGLDPLRVSQMEQSRRRTGKRVKKPEVIP